VAKGTIQNQETFLSNVAEQLGRARQMEKVERPDWKHQPQWNVLKEHSSDELVAVLKEQCKNIHTDVVETTNGKLPQVISEIIARYGGKNVVSWNDPRFGSFGLKPYLENDLSAQGINVHVWDDKLDREKNIEITERANVGITFSDITLAESGTVVLFSDNGKGRCVSLLPETYIAIIPKSTIVPRMTQATHEIHNRIQQGEQVASCVNFISGPSNSADIEMSLVVGVHGPVKVTYVIVQDK
jgi:L-lactate dehydrogenase complex protein LldG